MASVFKAFVLAILVTFVSMAAFAADERMSERVLGKANAPIRVDEYVSMTCSHCADFYATVLPEIEKKYIETGKVRFVMHDFPLDGISLKASAVARCMPVEQYVPFVKTLFSTQASWAFGTGNPENNVIQYAKLGGLPEEKARACANDAKLQEAIIAERTEATTKYKIEATPTFIVNDGVEVIKGTQTAPAFAAIFDRLLAAKK